MNSKLSLLCLTFLCLTENGVAYGALNDCGGSAKLLYDGAGVNDTIKQVDINGEAVVTASNMRAVDYGISVTPTEEMKRRSGNVLQMLERMMIPGLQVDVLSGSVQTVMKDQVSYFINGVMAQEWEIKAINPKRVERVDFLQSPPDPKYMNAKYVLNYVLREKDLGGYALVEANQYVHRNNAGDYGFAGRVNNRENSFTWLASGGYTNETGYRTEQQLDYIFSPDRSLSKSLLQTGNRRTRSLTTATILRHETKRLTLVATAGLLHNRTPEDHTDLHIDYSDNASTETGFTENNRRALAPYAYLYFQRNGVGKNAFLYGQVACTYNRNKANSAYQLSSLPSPLDNGSLENGWLSRMWVAYAFPLVRNNYMNVSLDYNSEVYHTDYSGTATTRQKLLNDNLYLRVPYNHAISQYWQIGGLLEALANSYKVNGNKRESTPTSTAR